VAVEQESVAVAVPVEAVAVDPEQSTSMLAGTDRVGAVVSREVTTVVAVAVFPQASRAVKTLLNPVPTQVAGVVAVSTNVKVAAPQVSEAVAETEAVDPHS